jgi:hypothetical protein
VAPHIDNVPLTTSPVDGTASFTLNVTPPVREGQLVRLVLGTAEFVPQPFAAGDTSLNFQIPNAPLGDHFARLRVDGIDSPIINPDASPPTFLNRRIKIE